MYKKLDSILTIQPEQTPPQRLSDCFKNESPSVRSLAGVKIILFLAIKSFVILLICFSLIK